MGFSNAEINRYIRHFAVDRIGLSGQAVLKKSSVICVGAGGLGCGALPYLVSCGVGAVGLIDHDVVELSNLQRQVLYTEKDIGRSKAVAAKNRLISLNDCVSVQAINQKLTQENATDLLKNYDLVIDGSDNFSTRYLVNDVCHQLKKPLYILFLFLIFLLFLHILFFEL